MQGINVLEARFRIDDQNPLGGGYRLLLPGNPGHREMGLTGPRAEEVLAGPDQETLGCRQLGLQIDTQAGLAGKAGPAPGRESGAQAFNGRGGCRGMEDEDVVRPGHKKKLQREKKGIYPRALYPE
jgi:hypothetical protein